MTRKQAREEAFILIFEKQINGESTEDILELAKEVREIEPDEYTVNTFVGVFDKIETIDSLISENLKGWSIKRLSKAVLAILRLAIYEMRYIEEIPVSVSINEAVELAKKYSGKEDSSFVNGLLGTLAKANA
ncbi:MAG: transcription antitermination factor NusB [Clostridia bacterium]|nr:transcription antitermination factor NusB [Clostridia bacterium]